jgi:excisionase family DNA binding protein
MTIYTYSMPKLYSDAEAADRLGISVATVRRMRVRGELGYLAIGRRVFVAEDQLKELLHRGRRDFTASVSDAASDEQSTVKAQSPFAARRSRLDPTFDRTSDELKHAYESAEVETAIDESDLASWLPDHYLPPVTTKRR